MRADLFIGPTVGKQYHINDALSC